MPIPVTVSTERPRNVRGLRLEATIEMPVKGLNTQVPTYKLEPDEAAKAQNARFVAGELRKRPGYTKLSTSSPIKGTEPVTGLFYWTDSSGTTHIIACGQTCIKELSAAGVWTDRTGTTTPTGSTTDMWHGAQIINPADNKKYLILTNGKDVPQKWDGTASVFSNLITTPPTGVTTVTAKAVSCLYGRVMLGNLKEDSLERPLSVRWSSLASMADFNGAGSGTADLFDSIGDSLSSTKIQSFSMKSGQLLVYLDNSITKGQVGSTADNAFYFPPTQQISDGIQSPSSLSPFILAGGSYDFFHAVSDLMIYDANSTYPVGSKITRGPDGLFNLINPNTGKYSFSLVNQYNKEIWLFYPRLSDAFSQDVAIYNFSYDDNSTKETAARTWSLWHLADQMTCGTQYFTSSIIRWMDATGTWAAATYPFGSGASSSNFPVALTGSTDGNVYLWGNTTYSDDGTAIEFDFETPDLDLGGIQNIPAHVNMLDRVDVYTRDVGATSLSVSVSTDTGRTFKTPVSKSFGGTEVGKETVQSFFMLVTGKTHRVRLYNNVVNQPLSVSKLILHFTIGPAVHYGYGLS